MRRFRLDSLMIGDLSNIRDKTSKGELNEAILYGEGVLRIKGHICVPWTSDSIRLIMEETHGSRYYIHWLLRCIMT